MSVAFGEGYLERWQHGLGNAPTEASHATRQQLVRITEGLQQS